MENEKTICIYCGKRLGETDDHVPPKSFYPKPRPSNLITVPACLNCNTGLGKDEEFFLATFMFSHAGISNTGKRLWSEKLHRMYKKNLGLKRKIAENLKHYEIITPAGLFLGRRMAINTDELRFERVVNKIVKGLYFFEYNEPLPAETKIMTLFLNDQERFDRAKNVVHKLKIGSRKWEGMFEYKFNRLSESLSESIWLLLFWDYATFLSFSYSDKKLKEFKENKCKELTLGST